MTHILLFSPDPFCSPQPSFDPQPLSPGQVKYHLMVSPHPVLPWSYPFFLLSGWASKNANLISHSTTGSHSMFSFPFGDWNKTWPHVNSPSIITNYFHLGLWTPELCFLSHVPFSLWLTVSLYIIFCSDPFSSPLCLVSSCSSFRSSYTKWKNLLIHAVIVLLSFNFIRTAISHFVHIIICLMSLFPPLDFFSFVGPRLSWSMWNLLAATWGIFRCTTWDLVPRRGIEPGTLQWEHGVLATREVPPVLDFKLPDNKELFLLAILSSTARVVT